jgi:type I restriction enzyme, S subunit
MVLCDRLEAARTAREAKRDRLAAASLGRLNAPDPATFPTDARFGLDTLRALTTRPDQIKQLEASIAIRDATRSRLLNALLAGALAPAELPERHAAE